MNFEQTALLVGNLRVRAREIDESAKNTKKDIQMKLRAKKE